MQVKATDEAGKRMDIARRVAQAYARLDGIDSLAVGGSTARGNADEFSDVEIWMTYSSLPNEKDRKRILDELDESGHPMLMRELEDGSKLAESMAISGVQVSLLPGTNDDLLAVGTDVEKYLGSSSEKGLADFHDCVVLYDPKRLYDVVKRRIEDYPVNLGTRIIQSKLSEVVGICAVDIPRAVKNDNASWLLECRSVAQEALLRIVFALNRDYFARVKDAEWLLKSMAYIPKNFQKNLREYAGEVDIRKARSMLLRLVKDVMSLTGRIWPQPISKEITNRLNRVPEELVPVLE